MSESYRSTLLMLLMFFWQMCFFALAQSFVFSLMLISYLLDEERREKKTGGVSSLLQVCFRCWLINMTALFLVEAWRVPPALTSGCFQHAQGQSSPFLSRSNQEHEAAFVQTLKQIK